jgi:tetraacyldisaccharide 4'-kinase
MHLFEFLYHIGLSASKHYSLRNRKSLPHRVVSIGNITTGGTGKTPAAIALAEEAKRRGLHPVILTRGYRGKAKGPCFVTRGEGPLLSAEEAGDEPVLMAERLAGVPVVKGGDRYEAGCYALQKLDLRNIERDALVFILDDGFQHWPLRRDKDIVLVDAVKPFGNGSLLPFGRLREPLRSLGRADIIVLSRADGSGASGQGGSVDALVKEIRRYNATAPVFPAAHKPLSCRLKSGEKKPPEWLSGKKVFGLCAIGNPLSFRKTVLSLGAQFLGCSIFRDHHRYRPSDVANVVRNAGRCGAEWIVTTEKDIIKLRNLGLPDNIVTIEVAFSVDEGFYEEVYGT